MQLNANGAHPVLPDYAYFVKYVISLRIKVTKYNSNMLTEAQTISPMSSVSSINVQNQANCGQRLITEDQGFKETYQQHKIYKPNVAIIKWTFSDYLKGWNWANPAT